MKRKRATRKVKSLSAKSVSAKRGGSVRGGGKKKPGGGDQVKYLEITMDNTMISGYDVSGK
jgi:hypothetical protein